MSKKNIHFHLKFPAVATIFYFQSVHKFHRETLGYKIYITNMISGEIFQMWTHQIG